MTQPTILTYYITNPEFPESMSWAAAMVPILKPGKKPSDRDAYVAGSSWVATGATEEEARAKLERVWADQYPPPSKRGAHLRKTSDPVAPVGDDLDCIL